MLPLFAAEPQVQAVTAATAVVVPMGDQRGQPSQVQGSFVPIALRPDFSFFGEMTKLADELQPGQRNVNPQQVQMR
jgi:hypothetical protein